MTRHIQTRHKDIQRVKDALVMKKERRIIEFQKIRREGMRLYNEKEGSKKHPVSQGERKQGKYKKLTQCSACLAFLWKTFFSLHKKELQNNKRLFRCSLTCYPGSHTRELEII